VWKIFADLSNVRGFLLCDVVVDATDADKSIHRDCTLLMTLVSLSILIIFLSWPRTSGFEHEGDKVYLAPEVLQGTYGKQQTCVGVCHSRSNFHTCQTRC
jgi:hypothetical protein